MRMPLYLKSTSGRVYHKVHKWTGSSHMDALKLLKSTSGRGYYEVHKLTDSSSLAIKFFKGRMHPNM